LIVSRLQSLFNGAGIHPSLIRGAIDTVERFQGQQRQVIIASYALGDPDAIRTEDEFLMSLNRFNVMASRARAKLVVLVSQEVVDHLSGDIDVLRESRLLKSYVESYCNQSTPMNLGYRKDGQSHLISGVFKYRV
jgi:superfamily I DNA and/or RNA helicase